MQERTTQTILMNGITIFHGVQSYGTTNYACADHYLTHALAGKQANDTMAS